MQANQLRLWFASMAYVLLCALRRIGLAHTQFAEATCGTIRLKLLKIGALVRVSVRRIKIAMASACPWQDAFELAHARLRNAIALIRTRQRTDAIKLRQRRQTAATAELYRDEEWPPANDVSRVDIRFYTGISPARLLVSMRHAG